MYDSEDLIYAAGFLDGEGCFYVYQGKIGVSCSNTDKPIIEWFHSTFGGSMRKDSVRKSHHRPTYTWKISTRQAWNYCCTIVPYLRVKQEQALLLIALQQTINKHVVKVPDSIKEERHFYAAKLKELKHATWT